MHKQNRFNRPYNFTRLCALVPALESFVYTTPRGQQSIPFADPQAVKTLNQALLKEQYAFQWDIPPGFLCPPVPGRLDYLLHLGDMLRQHGLSENIRGLDIGTGANLIYPLLAVGEFGWNMVGSEVDRRALQSATQLIAQNELGAQIELRQQNQLQHIFKGIIQAGDQFSFTLCNPPFHRSAAEARASTHRKADKLHHHRQKKSRATHTDQNPAFNFAGQHHELWCPGGERQFLENMVMESREFASQVGWFSSLVSKKETLPWVYQALKRVEPSYVTTVNMAQGQKQSRFVAWTFRCIQEEAQ